MSPKLPIGVATTYSIAHHRIKIGLPPSIAGKSLYFRQSQLFGAKRIRKWRPKNEEKPLPIDVGALGIDWLRRRTNDRDNDNDYAGSDNERSSPRNSGDQTSAISSR